MSTDGKKLRCRRASGGALVTGAALAVLLLWGIVAFAAPLPVAPSSAMPLGSGMVPRSGEGAVLPSVPLPAGGGLAVTPVPGGYGPGAQNAPYTLELAVYRGDATAWRVLEPLLAGQLGGAALAAPDVAPDFLAVTLRPASQGVSLYASASQTGGKPTEVSAFFADGKPVSRVVVFPRGAEKPDPLNPGGTARVFEGPVTVLIPLFPNSGAADAGVSAGEVTVHASGLACSAVNCTLFRLSGRIALPDAAALAGLPLVASAPWWGDIRAGVAERPAAPFGGSGADLRPTTPGARADQAAFSPDALAPVAFLPGLEVASLGRAVLFGFLAGVILNLMPCVLPVIGIKLAAMLGGGGGPAAVRVFRRHQVFFAAGILAWFTVLALLIRFFELAWGQIFQSPGVVMLLAVVLLLFAMSLFGVVSLPLLAVTVNDKGNRDIGAFANGFTATLLATPCGGPLLGGVIGWAVTQPFGVMAVAMGSVGLGMASPYLLLALAPGLAARLPRPGAWMLVMQRVLGFLLLGTVAYLVSLLPLTMLPRAGAALVLAGFGGWVWGASATARTGLRRAGRLCAAVCIVFACYWPLAPRAESVPWLPYTSAVMGELIGKRMILVDFTADWCPTCKVVEATALADDALRAWRDKYDLALVRVDLTRSNPEGEAFLRALGSASIPVIAVFGADSPRAPLILRDVVTRGQVAAALSRAATGK